MQGINVGTYEMPAPETKLPFIEMARTALRSGWEMAQSSKRTGDWMLCTVEDDPWKLVVTLMPKRLCSHIEDQRYVGTDGSILFVICLADYGSFDDLVAGFLLHWANWTIRECVLECVDTIV